MDERLIRQIQREGAEALLNMGVSLPLKDFKIPFRKEPLRLRLTMRRPTMACQIQIAKTWLSVGMTLSEFEALDYDGQMRFLVEHGRKLSRMIALTMPHWWLPTCVLAWFIRHSMKWEYQKGAFEKFVTLMGTAPFTNIIRSAEIVNPMKLRLSHRKKGS
jgi:hypothetical protein